MHIRTKIVCTIGPAVSTPEKIEALIERGMSVARLNFSHGTYEDHRRVIEMLKGARKKLGRPLAIMLDTKGPEIRVGLLEEPMAVRPGTILHLVPGPQAPRAGVVPVIPPAILHGLRRGAEVLFDDGYIVSEVVENTTEGVKVEVKNEGLLKPGKGINVPDVSLDIPLVTDRDREDIAFGCSHDIDLLAASFVVGPDQLLTIKRLLLEHGQPTVGVIAKIETSRGIRDFDDILQVADGIMIARGDLGVELPLSRVPALQKMMIRKCHEAGKPSIVATQMLESMMNSSRPTRAEASDVANGIYESASAVMLSGETAAGKYPRETVAMMREIVAEAEKDFNYQDFFFQARLRPTQGVPSAVSVATVRTAISADAKAIFVITSSGQTARLISNLRPGIPIIAVTPTEKVYNQLAFEWGVVPVLSPPSKSIEEAFATVSQWALDHGYVHYGDLVVVTAGVPYGIAGTTNMLMVESIGDVVVRGTSGQGEVAVGEVEVIYDLEEAIRSKLSDKVVVISKCTEAALPLLKRSKGVVLQNHADDRDSADYLLLVATSLGLPAVVGADGAIDLLKSGEEVTLDPECGLVYRGDLRSELGQSG